MHFKGSLVGFSMEQIKVKIYIALKNNFGVGEQPKKIKVVYIIIDSPSFYNNIIGDQLLFDWAHHCLLYACA